jgi:hypothetical protein
MNDLFRYLLLGYFMSHVPITILVDLQILFTKYYPVPLQNLFTWYLVTFKDFVCINNPPWLQSFIWAELFFQLPYFFVAIYGLLYKKDWIRIPSIFYGIHVATTVWPILAETVLNAKNTQSEKIALCLVYFPYFFFPLSLAVYMGINSVPFQKSTKLS